MLLLEQRSQGVSAPARPGRRPVEHDPLDHTLHPQFNEAADVEDIPHHPQHAVLFDL